MQNETTKATWIARGGEPVRAVLDLDKGARERTLGDHLATRCTSCGVLGAKVRETVRGPECELCS
jgi:hypothetical protein